MIISLYGPTGAGKSTLAQAFQRIERFSIVSTGDFVRKNFPNDPLIGGFSDREKQIREYVDQEIMRPDVILDGFPRHERQLEWLLMACGALRPVHHVFLEISRDEAQKRIELRNREDMPKFTEQYEGQVRACATLHEAVHRLNQWHTHLFGEWAPDELARWIFLKVKGLHAK